MKNRKFSPSRRKVVCLPFISFAIFFAVPSCYHANSLAASKNCIFSTFRLIDLLVGGQNYWFYWYIGFFRLFLFSTSWWEVKILSFIEYIVFFRLFDLLLGGQTDRFYWICCIFWLFDLLLGGQIDWFYWIYFNFSTFWLFELLVKWWEVKW